VIIYALYSFPGWGPSDLSISPGATCFRAGLSLRLAATDVDVDMMYWVLMNRRMSNEVELLLG
jgi:hypothetical protein